MHNPGDRRRHAAGPAKLKRASTALGHDMTLFISSHLPHLPRHQPSCGDRLYDSTCDADEMPQTRGRRLRAHAAIVPPPHTTEAPEVVVCAEMLCDSIVCA